MRQFALILALLIAGIPGPAPAQSAEIEATIRSQLDAFLADDLDTAFGFASPGIRSMFRTPENFGAMVQQGYPMVWRPGDVRFLRLRESGGAHFQDVLIRDARGVAHVLEYRMTERPDGWRIGGVRLLDPPGVSA